MHHLQLLEDAKVAIKRVFGDTSVSKGEIIDSLEELAEDLDNRIECLKDEMRG